MNDTELKIYNIDSIDTRLESMKTHTSEDLTEVLTDRVNFLKENAIILQELEKFFEALEEYQDKAQDEYTNLNRHLSAEKIRLKEQRLDAHIDRAIARHLLDLKDIQDAIEKDE